MEKINNIAELKQRVGIANSNISLLGYYSVGDGGGGEFYWDSTSTEADNGGTIIQVTGVTTGRWKRVFQEIVYPEYYGAKGDGVTNDLQNINKCFLNHKNIEFYKKIYNVDGQITLDGKDYIVNGNGATINRKYNASNPNEYLIFANNISNSILYNISFSVSENTPHSQNGWFIRIENSNNLKIYNNIFNAFSSISQETIFQGLELRNCNNCVINNNSFISIMGIGLGIIGFSGNGVNNIIDSNYFYNCKDTGLGFFAQSENNIACNNIFNYSSTISEEAGVGCVAIDVTGAGTKVSIVNNHITNGGIGIRVLNDNTIWSNKGLVIDGNYIANQKSYNGEPATCIKLVFESSSLEANHVIITNNTFDMGSNNSQALVCYLYKSDNILKIDGNVFNCNSTITGSYMVNLQSTSIFNINMHSGKNSFNKNSNPTVVPIYRTTGGYEFNILPYDDSHIDSSVDGSFNNSSTVNYLLPKKMRPTGVYVVKTIITSYSGINMVYNVLNTSPTLLSANTFVNTAHLNSDSKVSVNYTSHPAGNIVSQDYTELFRVL